MKIIALLSTLAACCSAFSPSSSSKAPTTALNAEMSRMAFVSAAAASVFGVAMAQQPAAFAMDQENIDDPTEQWETGSPTASAKELRKTRFTSARTQNTSNYPPIKRLTLERKSPVVRAASVRVCSLCLSVPLLTFADPAPVLLQPAFVDPPGH